MTDGPIELPPEADDYLWDPARATREDDIAALEGVLRTLRFDGQLPDLDVPEAAAPLLPWRDAWPWLAAAVVLLVLGGMVWSRDAEPMQAEHWSLPPVPTAVAQGSGWALSVVGGAPTCDGVVVDRDTQLRVGTWLETQKDTRALLSVADLGRAEIAENTRLRIVETGPRGHVIELRRGRLDVTLDAPPELVTIRTPYGDVVDLGCAYYVDVGPRSLQLEVSLGVVAMRRNGLEMRVPADHRIEATIDRVTLPLARSASPAFAQRVGTRDLEDWLTVAQPGDVVTLWNAARRHPADRARVVQTMQRLGVAAPSSGLPSSDAELQLWWPAVVEALESAPPDWQPARPAPEERRAPVPPAPDRRAPVWGP